VRDNSSGRTRRALELSLTLTAPLILLAIWEALSRTGRVNPLFWPPPSSLWGTFREELQDGSLLTDVRVSLLRILGGFVLGAVPGIALGLAMGLSWPIRVFFMPIAAAVYAIPKIAVLPLVIFSAVMLLVFELAVIYKLLLSTRDFTREMQRLTATNAGQPGAGAETAAAAAEDAADTDDVDQDVAPQEAGLVGDLTDREPAQQRAVPQA